ncbi:hypothetical protein AVEN_271403-1 [Araneus ventricosus]|uniref:Secreted protein n=1 Tax=Araneus ventricosus TaxID=182803 RepID=A0A4Y2IVL2_ARAVE|nr:hypothetical protein AVEN_271403-1 [Araneus ventricosus]
MWAPRFFMLLTRLMFLPCQVSRREANNLLNRMYWVFSGETSSLLLIHHVLNVLIATCDVIFSCCFVGAWITSTKSSANTWMCTPSLNLSCCALLATRFQSAVPLQEPCGLLLIDL